jgi:hypothetical protein
MKLWRTLICGLLFFCTAVPALQAADWQPENTCAVIAGVLKWESEAKGITHFSDRNRKDQELYRTLLQRGVPKENIACRLDEQATRENIRQSVRTMAARAKPGATLLFYYAGHGTKDPDGKVSFLNYDYDPDRAGKKPAFALSELADLLVAHFKGGRVLLMADCCYSGGLAEVARRLSRAGFEAASLTSADAGTISTGNWTFTQTILDGLNGNPLADANGDGVITLDEMADEVSAAMKAREKQRYGYALQGLAGDFKIVPIEKSGKAHAPPDGPFALKEYVYGKDAKETRVGRIVDYTEGRYVLEFYDYSDKRTAKLPADSLSKIQFKTYKVGEQFQVLWQRQLYDARVLEVAGDFHLITYPGWSHVWDEWVLSTQMVERGAKTVRVKWQREWYPAVVLKTEGKKYYIHYVGYDDTDDEWVTEDRIEKTKP